MFVVTRRHIRQSLPSWNPQNIKRDLVAMTHWQKSHNLRQPPMLIFHSKKSWQVFLTGKKISTSLKAQLLEHTMGKATREKWES